MSEKSGMKSSKKMSEKNWNEVIQDMNEEIEKTEQIITDEVHCFKLTPERAIELLKQSYLIPPKANIVNAYMTNKGIAVLYNLKRA